MAPTKQTSSSASKSSSSKKRSAQAPARSDPKRPATSQGVKGGKATKNTVTKSLTNHGFSASKRPQYQVGTKILLDDSIYDDKVPAEVKGKLFVYEISSIDANGKQVTIQYKNLVISNGGDRFRQYEEGEDPQVRQ
jgi:hypothetical protein